MLESIEAMGIIEAPDWARARNSRAGTSLDSSTDCHVDCSISVTAGG